ncbi:hypothetical protein [Coleofasciculus sp. G2-EDA-02]|uniref:hypothetical protein n=1 Tax=Coleofasciculus sp. G2-EDA-02 TaxID=3069529 RepID=UPI0040638E8E
MVYQQLVRKIRAMHLGKRFRVLTQMGSGHSSRFSNGKWLLLLVATWNYNRAGCGSAGSVQKVPTRHAREICHEYLHPSPLTGGVVIVISEIG